MANEISLVTASGRTVTPKDDGIIYEVFSPGNGIIYGGAVTIKDSSTLHITAGHGIVCGRKFTIDDSDIPVSLSGSGSLLGRLYIHLDLADAADPITLLVETGASLTPVVQDADVNINNGVYEINIATFDVDTSTISNLVNLDVTVAPMGDMEGATSALDGKGGYVPAPQAGDEDKVLKGDGTWGTAGDTATVRYNKTTKFVQLLDDDGWFDWKKASRTLENKIPAMTSNTAPSGGCTGSGAYGGDYYHAFDRNAATFWQASSGSNSTTGDGYVDYQFSTVTDIDKIVVKYAPEAGDILQPASVTFSYSDDGIAYQNIGTENISSEVYEYELSQTISARNIRVKYNSRNVLSNNHYYYIRVSELQALGH